MWSWITGKISHWILTYLDKTSGEYEPFAITDPETLQACLRPGDVLLVEGNKRISAVIKYLTQSTWSHSAFYIGNGQLIEALAEEGVIQVPLSKYATFNTRICRPAALTEEDREAVITFMTQSVGKQYDVRNVTDLMRYLITKPPVPIRWRRRMLAFGSGDPTRAICSTLIAQAFQQVRYPILPHIETQADEDKFQYLESEIHHIRHHSLFTPRDFDISPYFHVVKPTIETGFDYKSFVWHENVAPEDTSA